MNEEQKRALWSKVDDGDEAAVRKALAADASLATEYAEFNYQPTTMMTMLHVAASRDHVGIMKLLIDAGADVSAVAPPGKGRMMPIHCAARGKGPAVKLLLEHGASASAFVKRGVTPLYTAAFRGQLEVCRLLLEAGADANGRPSSAMPLFAAAQQSQIPVIDLLLKHGATLSKKNSKKETALHLAARWGNAEVNQHLLKLGLDPDQANKKGQTPRALSRENYSNREALAGVYGK